MTFTEPDVMIVDENDNPIGAKPRPTAYDDGDTVRITRVLLQNGKGEYLIQRRSALVPWPLVWNDSAAGHVDKDESYLEAANRELEEEMGITSVKLTEVAHYFAVEYFDGQPSKRFNTLFAGSYKGEVNPNEEVEDYKWISGDKLDAWMKDKISDFSTGFIEGYTRYSESKT